jgi:hypothetical protein
LLKAGKSAEAKETVKKEKEGGTAPEPEHSQHQHQYQCELRTFFRAGSADAHAEPTLVFI